MQTIYTTPINTISELHKVLASSYKGDILGYFVVNQPLIIIPAWQDKIIEYNKDYVERTALPRLELPIKGGTIVANMHDLGFLYISDDLYSMWNLALQKHIAEYLHNKYKLNTSVNNNDVLIDNKKFIGTASGFIENKHVFGIFISMNEDTTWLINKICLKPSNYAGFTGLFAYGVCIREIINLVINFSIDWERRNI